jgi:hypothetical protein
MPNERARGPAANPEGLGEFMRGLSFEPSPSTEEDAALLKSLLPAGSDVVVVRSLRLPLELDQAVAAAKATDVPKTAWIRQAIDGPGCASRRRSADLTGGSAPRTDSLRPARHVA